jgi:transcriptional regulator with AAA-type ATPase domain
MSLCRLGPGATFGEIALLRGGPATADVVATTRSTLLRLPASDFSRALRELPELGRVLLDRLAGNLADTSHEAWAHFRRVQALSTLVRGSAELELVAESARGRALKSRIEGLARGTDSILLRGEAGTGRLHGARVLHALSDRSDAPLVVVDCAELDPDDAAGMLLGTLADSRSHEVSGVFGAVHVAYGGTLVLRHIESLDEVTQAMVVGFVSRPRTTSDFGMPTVRVVATVAAIDAQPDDHSLLPELIPAFDHVLDVSSLADRRRDILPLARHFLGAGQDPAAPLLSPSAERAVAGLDYRHRNVAELKDIIDLARRCAEGREIRAEHIFGGLDAEQLPAFDLSRTAAGPALRAARPLAALRWMVAAGFAAVVLAGLWLPTSAVARAGNAFVWNLWEPAVFGAFLFVGAVWCTVCPLSLAGRSVHRIGGISLQRPPPAWLKRVGGWLAATAFAVVLWIEHTFNSVAQPFATGALLLGLVAAAVASALIWQREVWCRHLCPLGQLATVLAPAAPLAVVARRQVCAAACSTHECYRGNGEVAGCTVFHHPQHAAEAHRCKLCLDCLRSCPHASTGLVLRPPLASAWRLGAIQGSIAPFALALTGLAPLFLAASTGGPLSEPGLLAAAAVAVVSLAAVVMWRLPSLLGPPHPDRRAIVDRLATGLAIIAWGPLMALQVRHLEWTATIRLHAATPIGSLDLAAAPLVEAGVIVVAATLGAIVLWRTVCTAARDRHSIRSAAVMACTVIALAVTVISLLLI